MCIYRSVEVSAYCYSLGKEKDDAMKKVLSALIAVTVIGATPLAMVDTANAQWVGRGFYRGFGFHGFGYGGWGFRRLGWGLGGGYGYGGYGGYGSYGGYGGYGGYGCGGCGGCGGAVAVVPVVYVPVSYGCGC
jgi:hypothetical protein